MQQFEKISRKDPFILNLSLSFVYSIFKEDFLIEGYPEEDFDDFFKSVFKNKIQMIKC